jgi:hypothetical protein
MLSAACLIRPGRCKCCRNIATTDITNKEEVSDEKISSGDSVVVRYYVGG